MLKGTITSDPVRKFLWPFTVGSIASCRKVTCLLSIFFIYDQDPITSNTMQIRKRRFDKYIDKNTQSLHGEALRVVLDTFISRQWTEKCFVVVFARNADGKCIMFSKYSKVVPSHHRKDHAKRTLSYWSVVQACKSFYSPTQKNPQIFNKFRKLV